MNCFVQCTKELFELDLFTPPAGIATNRYYDTTCLTLFHFIYDAFPVALTEELLQSILFSCNMEKVMDVQDDEDNNSLINFLNKSIKFALK